MRSCGVRVAVYVVLDGSLILVGESVKNTRSKHSTKLAKSAK